MFKYIKWELKEEFRSKLIPLIAIIVVFLLYLILPEGNSIASILSIPFIVIIFGSLLLSYFYGAYRTMKSHEKQTFLLESMIPLPPNKLLLAKYILGILFDIIFVILFVIGVAITLYKIGDVDIIKEILKLFFNMNFDGFKVLIRVAIMMLSSTISFTSFTTLVYLVIKSFLPNFKGVAIISIISGVFLFSTVINGFLKELLKTFENMGQYDIIFSLSLLVVTVVCYFVSVWFIKNKLEVYN